MLVYQWIKKPSTLRIIAAVFLLAALKIVAGAVNYEYRNRGLGLVALALTTLSVVTVCCAPSALVLLIYGLVVYLNPAARQAFTASPAASLARDNNAGDNSVDRPADRAP